MKLSEAGFTALEVIIAVFLASLMVGAATTVTIYALKNNQQTSDHTVAVLHADTAGYWVSNDTRMAQSVTAEGLTSPDFLILAWTDWGYAEDSVYHVVTYSIEDVSGGIGKLKRTHQDSGGTYEEVIITDRIYYDDADPDNSTQVSYRNSILNLKVVTSFGQSQEVREYEVYCRPNFQ